jgi:hypothetical protein
MILLSGVPGPEAAESPFPNCNVVIREEGREREDAELALDVARSNVAAYGEIYGLIEGLWKADATERMTYLRAKYDNDAAKLALEQSELIVARERAEEAQYRLICGVSPAPASAAERERAVAKASQDYRNADCDQRAKSIEVAKVNLEFRRQFLASVLELRKGDVATRPDVILAELDVAREEKRLADAERRTAACNRELGRTAAAEAPSGD